MLSSMLEVKAPQFDSVEIQVSYSKEYDITLNKKTNELITFESHLPCFILNSLQIDNAREVKFGI